MKAFLVDDEPLALSRLKRLLLADGRVEIVGANKDPRRALAEIPRLCPDVLFLDIQMPEISGFELLERLKEASPLVIFTTAFGEYALEAFKVNSIDYLLKPIQRAELGRAVSKLERILRGTETRGDIQTLLMQFRARQQLSGEYLTRVASRTAKRVELIDIRQITHFYSEDKLTFAATTSRDYALDLSLAELQQRLPPGQWVRIHRSTLLNADAVKELHSWMAGRVLVRLRNGKQLQVARERIPELKQKLGL